jgi:predicted ATPase/signal transduction histidine kinase
MLTFDGYTITETLHEGGKSMVYRATRKADGQPVVLKVLRGDQPTPAEVERFRLQYEIVKDLDLDGVVRVLGQEELDQRPVLVLEDFGGVSLARYLNGRPLGLQTFLDVAVDLAQHLAAIHRRGVIHRDINPANIIINPETREVKIADFGLASRLSREAPQSREAGQTVGTLRYISPEQTGRINRCVDHRSDLYSLGATFHQLLTGAPPFAFSDPLELVHAHIARNPEAPEQLNPEVPKILSAMVQMLLAKAAEERYQTARGLAADLAQLRRRFAAGDALDFVLCQQDVSDRFQISQRLYGRSKELAALTAALDRVGRGGHELLLLAGEAGAGKSALVREIRQLLAHRGAVYASGKVEQYQRSVPYAPVIEALRRLVQWVLTRPAAQVEAWRVVIIERLGPNAGLVSDAVAELELVIGPQPALPALPPSEARNRLHITLLRFVGLFARAEHPLVLFVDDLQWADSGTLELLELLLTDRESAHLLLLGAYRENEVSPTHPLRSMLERASEAEAAVRTVELGPLEEQDLCRLVADTLRCPPERAAGLATVVFDKTRGNPFFVNQLLRALHHGGQLSFDPEAAAWTWDLDQIQGVASTDNVVELMIAGIRHLSAGERAVLMSAACIGSTFDLATLSLICEETPRSAADKLRQAIRLELVLPLGDAYQLAGVGPATDVRYTFLHDRVQQAAYSMIPAQERTRHHLRIGRLLLADDEEQEQRIFDIVQHLDEALELITDRAERAELAELNLRAGDRARATSAHAEALRYLEVGVSLLEPACWRDQHELAFALHFGRAECAFLAGDLQRAEETFALLHEKASSRLQHADVYVGQLMLYEHAGQYQENREIGLEALELLGLPLGGEVTPERIAAGFERFFQLLGDRPIEALADLPELTDPDHHAVMAVLTNVLSSAFISDQAYFALFSLEMVNLTLEHGNCDYSPFGYGCLAILFNAQLGRIDQAYATGMVGWKLQQRFGLPTLQCKLEFMLGCFILPWKRDIDECLETLLQAHQTGTRLGDLVFAGYAMAIRFRYLYTAGRPLQGINEESLAFDPFVARLYGDYLAVGNLMMRHMRMALAGETAGPISLSGDDFDEEANAAEWERKNVGLDIIVYQAYKAQLHVMHGQHREAFELSERYAPYIVYQASMYDQLIYWIYRGVAAAALAVEGAEPGVELYAAALAGCRQQLDRWVASAPDNFTAPHLILEGAQARLDGHPVRAVRRYDAAAAAASGAGNLLLQALAHELAGQLYLDEGLQLEARAHLLACRGAYRRWGARAKVAQLDRAYPRLAVLDHGEPVISTGTSTSSGSSGSSTSSGSTDHRSAALDLGTVIKAGEVIASEIVLDSLLTKLLAIAIENAGAQRGVLVLEREGRLTIEVARDGDETTVVSEVVDYSRRASATVINYVYRSEKSLVLSASTADQHFDGDPYLVENQTRSVLCIPLIAQAKLSGILYLENNLTEGAFTAERLETLQLLSTQMASALENARLYREIENEVAQRTEELRQTNQQLRQTLSELQSTQAQLLQSKKMADLGGLAAGVAHELNSPVGALTSSADVTARCLAQITEALEQAESLEQCRDNPRLARALTTLEGLRVNISGSCARIGEIAGSLAGFAGLDRASLRLVDIRQGLRSALTLLTPQLGERIEVQAELEEVPEILCNPSDLNQVWMNLLKNAAEAIEVRGTIRVRTCAEGDRVRVEIEDDGRGMSPEQLASLFDFQFANSTRVHLGMGLKVAYAIVEQHGGTLSADSPGQGMRMVVLLPVGGKGA